MRNDGAAVTRTWECRLPADVIRRSPMERRFVLLSDTIPERPAELRPIPCPHCQGRQQGKRSSSLKKYSAIHVQGEAPESDDSSRDCEAKRVHLSLLAGAYSTRQSFEPLLALKVIGIFHVSKKVLWSPVMAGAMSFYLYADIVARLTNGAGVRSACSSSEQSREIGTGADEGADTNAELAKETK